MLEAATLFKKVFDAVLDFQSCNSPPLGRIRNRLDSLFALREYGLNLSCNTDFLMASCYPFPLPSKYEGDHLSSTPTWQKGRYKMCRAGQRTSSGNGTLTLTRAHLDEWMGEDAKYLDQCPGSVNGVQPTEAAWRSS